MPGFSPWLTAAVCACETNIVGMGAGVGGEVWIGATTETNVTTPAVEGESGVARSLLVAVNTHK